MLRVMLEMGGVLEIWPWTVPRLRGACDATGDDMVFEQGPSLSILGVIYPMRSTVEMARLVDERDGGWSHRFRSDLERIEQYAECGCELVVTEPLTNLPELWENLEADRNALWQRILDLSGYDLNDGGTTR